MDDSPNFPQTVGNGKQALFTCERTNLRTSPVATNSPAFAESPRVCETPVRERRLSKISENEVYSSRTGPASPMVPLANLPIHTTPPSRFKNFVIQNPFDENVRKNLHLPFISPTLFTKAISPSQEAENFSWSIEDLANLFPAEIDEFQSQNEQTYDEQTEQEVQKSISRFFESSYIVPSPWGAPERCKPLSIYDISCTPGESTNVEVTAPNITLDFEENEELFSSFAKREAWTQTELTVSNDALSPFDFLSEEFSLRKDQNEAEEVTTNDDGSSIVLGELVCSSPYKPYKSFLSSTIHTPKNKIIRNFGTPLGRSSLMSPIGLSPIVQTFQQVTMNFEVSQDSARTERCTCNNHNGISCDSGIASIMSQTDVSFPNILPKHAEEILKPHRTFIQDQSEMEDVNLNSSLSRRRKLLFHENLDMSVSSIDSTANGYDSA